MPTRAPSICHHAGCSALTTGRFCKAHEAEHQQRNRKGFANGKTTERGYGAAWRKLRQAVMARDDWLCQACRRHGRLSPATQVDHVIAKAHGGTDDLANLQAICERCHNGKTAREGRGKSLWPADE